jgi:hypothetical protein
MAVPCKKRLVQTTLFIDRSFIMKCIWRIHGSKPYIFRWSLVYNTSVFCFSHFHLEGVGGWSEPNETNFIWKKLSHFETIPKCSNLLPHLQLLTNQTETSQKRICLFIIELICCLYCISWNLFFEIQLQKHWSMYQVHCPATFTDCLLSSVTITILCHSIS